MEISVRLSEEDLQFLDGYAAEHGLESRSAALCAAIDALRAGQLGDAYEHAWTTRDAAGEADVWDALAGDGLEA